MAAIADLSDLVNRMTGGNSGTPENIFWWKLPYIAGTLDSWAVGYLYSTWLYDGYPGGGAVPTSTPGIPTNATAGAIPVTDPGGGRQKWLTQAQLMETGGTGSFGMAFLYDRLLHQGALSGTVTTAQTVGGTITRNTGGVGNAIFIEIYTAVGTTARTITASYTNSAGTSGRTTTATVFGGTVGTAGNDANLMIPIPLQAGDVGVRSVESVTISASTGTAGSFGVTIAKPISWLTIRYQTNVDFTTGPSGGPKEVYAGACLSLVILALSTAETGVMGMFTTVEA